MLLILDPLIGYQWLLGLEFNKELEREKIVKIYMYNRKWMDTANANANLKCMYAKFQLD